MVVALEGDATDIVPVSLVLNSTGCLPNTHRRLRLRVSSLLRQSSWAVNVDARSTTLRICPVALRPYLTTYVNLCWVMGQFIASGVLRGFLDVQSEWAFRGPFAIQWVWPIPILIVSWNDRVRLFSGRREPKPSSDVPLYRVSGSPPSLRGGWSDTARSTRPSDPFDASPVLPRLRRTSTRLWP